MAADNSTPRSSINNVDNILSELDRIISLRSQSLGGEFLLPLLNQISATLPNNASGAGNSSHPVNVIMNISTPDATSFRMSQGQLLAEAAAAIMRATRRNI